MVKVLCLGNEFIEEDSFAKKVCSEMDVVNVKDSFELMDILRNEDDLVIIDVVRGLDKVSMISTEELQHDSILSAHDFDASFLIGLLNPDVKIIGLPQTGELGKVREELKQILEPVDF